MLLFSTREKVRDGSTLEIWTEPDPTVGAIGKPYSASLTVTDGEQQVLVKDRDITDNTNATPAQVILSTSSRYMAVIKIVSGDENLAFTTSFDRICYHQDGTKKHHGKVHPVRVPLGDESSISQSFISILMA